MQSHKRRTLGPLIARYRYRPFTRRTLFNLTSLGLAGVFAPWAYAQYRYDQGYTQYGLAAAQAWSRPWYLLAAFAALVFLALLSYRLLLARRHVALHQNGLLLRLGRRQGFLWSHLAGIATLNTARHFLGIPLNARYYATLYPGIGQPILLTDDLENLPELVTQIKARLYPRLAEKLGSSFEEGKWLHFGPLSICQEGLRVNIHKGKKHRSARWPQVDRLEVRGGHLVIVFLDHKKVRLPTAKIPNIELCLQIIKEGVKVWSGVEK